jgi:DNA-binding Xre family transcriptional regulator
MSKFIFILFLLFSTINSFSQNSVSDKKGTNLEVRDKKIKVDKEKVKVLNEAEIDLLLNNNLCDFLSIKPSDLLNEKMLKKLKANV